MPTALIKSYAEKTKKSEGEVEAAWERAKKMADGIRKSSVKDDDYWRLVNGLLKIELGLNEELTLSEFCLLTLPSDKYVF
jgi:hypothetical protein